MWVLAVIAAVGGPIRSAIRLMELYHKHRWESGFDYLHGKWGPGRARQRRREIAAWWACLVVTLALTGYVARLALTSGQVAP